MAKTSERPCIAYQRDTPLPPSAEKGFPNELHNTLQARKSRAKLSSAWQHLHSCLMLLALSSSLPPAPLLQVAISHYPRLKRLQGVAASASSSLTNNTPTTRTTTAQHSTQGVAPLGGTQACPSHFCTFLQMGLHLRSPSVHPLAPLASSVQKLHQIHENIFQKLH